MNESLERYFTERPMAPVLEWQKESETNKDWHMGDKSFEYVITLTGHEPLEPPSD